MYNHPTNDYFAKDIIVNILFRHRSFSVMITEKNVCVDDLSEE
jgi:hypothetical protein